MTKQQREDFEQKVENKRFKTAELKSGGFISIADSYMQNGVAVFWGKYKGSHGMWFEGDLKNFVL